MPMWNLLFVAERTQRGLQQADVAAQAGISEASLSRYERGTRRPSRSRLLRLCHVVGLDRLRTNALLAATGYTPLPTAQLARFEERRGTLASVQQEIDGYSWPCLVQNDRSEIVLWNAPAARLAELDFARALPLLSDRNLLRIAAMPHFRDRIVNWAEVVGALIAVFKGTPSMDIAAATGVSPYYAAVVADLMRDAPRVLEEILALWGQTPAWADASRMVFQAQWWLAAGQELRFDGVHSPLSLFDSTSTIDWFPADGPSCAWLQAAAPVATDGIAEESGQTVAQTPWHVLLRMGRDGAGLTRQELASSTPGVSLEAVKSYELGRRRPPRETVLQLAWAMELDGATTNAILTGLGFDPEPSEYAQLVAGEPAQTHFYREVPLADRLQRSHQRMSEHLARQSWPCLLIDEQCRILATNAPMDELLGPLARADTRGTLLQLVLSAPFRRAVVNWDELVTALLPTVVKQALESADVTVLPAWFRAALTEAHSNEPGLLTQLQQLLRDAPAVASTFRIVAPLYWQTAEAQVLAFTSVLSLWSGTDTIWALDWHPTEGETWAWLAQNA